MSKNYIITINNPPIKNIEWINKDKIAFITGQLEKGEQGTEHLQIACQTKSVQRVTALHKIFPGGHVEISRNFPASIKYCQKEDTRIDGPWTYGEIPKNKTNCKRNLKDLIELDTEELLQECSAQGFLAVKKVQKTIELEQPKYNHPNVRGIWVSGKPGTGKSHMVRNIYKDAYIKDDTKWFDGYNGEQTIILEDLEKDNCLKHQLKIWMDSYHCTAEIKGGIVNLRHHRFIITSNYIPEQIWEDDDVVQAIRRRCTFYELKDIVENKQEKKKETLELANGLEGIQEVNRAMCVSPHINECSSKNADRNLSE